MNQIVVKMQNIDAKDVEEALARSVQVRDAVTKVASEVKQEAIQIAQNEISGHGKENKHYIDSFEAGYLDRNRIKQSENTFVRNALGHNTPPIFAMTTNTRHIANLLEWGTYVIKPKLIMTRAAMAVAERIGAGIEIKHGRDPGAPRTNRSSKKKKGE